MTRLASLWDRAAVGGLAVAGFVLSYDALRQMAAAAHVRPVLTWLFPLIVDGFIAYGVRALLLMRRARPAARAYVWLLLAVATGASIWANVLHAVRLNQQVFTHGPVTNRDGGAGLQLGDGVVGVLSAVAPLALAGAVHLHTLIHHPGDIPDADTPHPNRNLSAVDIDATTDAADRAPAWSTESGEPGRLSVEAGLPVDQKTGQVPSPPTAVTGQESSEDVGHGVRPASPADAEAPTPRPDAYLPQAVLVTADPASARRGRRPTADDAVLLGIARAVEAGTGRLSRAAVRDAISAQGLAVGNDRLTVLMRQLRAEAPPRTKPLDRATT
ncbi:DUF2637 domain-containing protein [Streptodolium elevatio]